jgi:hypothetical protein
MALDDPQFQPAPWTLHGEAIVGLKLVPRDIAQRLVPPDAKVVAVWPKRTLAILFLAQYRDSPVGEYRELIVAPALVRYKGRIGFWISHIRVDNYISLAAGRAIWALPKQMASMEWSAGRISISGPQLKLQAVVKPPRVSLRLPFFGTAMSKYGLSERSFAVRGAARIGLARASVELADDAGLAALGMAGTMTAFVCKHMQVTIGRPHG